MKSSSSEKKEPEIFPRKKFSQHFLINLKAAKMIVDYLDLKSGQRVLEIGPGKGVLTKYLLEKKAKVFGVELDRDLCKYLQEKFRDDENLKVINQDILKFDSKKLAEKEGNLKVIGNLPYQITSPILEYLIQNREVIDLAILTVQKEVAKRICAKPDTSDWSPLSIGVQIFSTPEILFNLKPNSFFPPPKVDSAVIRLEFLEKPRVPVELPFFTGLVKSLFTQRRKNILNSLSRSLGLNKDKVKAILEEVKIEPQSRAEVLSLEELSNLVSLILKRK